MKWIEVRIETTEEASDAVSEMLTSMGAGGVSIEDPGDIRRQVLKPGSLDYADDEFLSSLGENVAIKAYFPKELNLLRLIEQIKEKMNFISNFLNVGKGSVAFSEVDDEDWSTSWKKYYKPLHISESIVVKPTWEDYQPKEGEIVVELDPGMAFGTGTHETTRMCAQLLEKYVQEGDRIIDVGCGTGILSIISIKLGASSADAIDIDDVAVKVASENGRLNNVESKINVFKSELKNVKIQKYDIVVANIVANVIIELCQVVPCYLRPHGYFIASGIIKERKDEIISAYSNIGFSCEDVRESGEWVAIAFKCQSFL